MKASGILLWVASMAVTTCPTIAQTNLTSMDPVRLKFGAPTIVFLTNETVREAIDFVELYFMPTNEFVLDGKTQVRHAEVWCKREGGDYYSRPFYMSRVSIEELQKLRSASLDQFKALLGFEPGRPGLMEGSVDHAGTVVWQWRICNGQRGETFQAIEITTGINWKGQDHILFLITRVAKGELKRSYRPLTPDH